MRHATKTLYPLHLVLVCVLVLVWGVSVAAQTPDNGARAAKKAPVMKGYKGVMIGMTANDIRLKLGEPLSKSDAQDYYAITEMESVQVFYNAEFKATTISIMYMDKNAPTGKDVLGEEVAPKADGSLFKKIEYKEAGYSVLYCRSASETPITTVTFQKL